MENQPAPPVTINQPQQTTPATIQTPPPQPVSTTAFSAKPPPFFKSAKFKILILVLILLILAGASFYFYRLSKQPKPAAQVGSDKITKEDVQKFIRDCDIAQNEAINYLVDEKVLTKWALDEKITIPQDDLKNEEVRISGSEAKFGCITTQAKVNLLREKLKNYATDFREGKLIVVNFGRYMPSPFGIEHAEASDSASKEKLYREDKQYADSLAQSIYSDLNNKTLTFEQAIEKALSDPKVGKKGNYATSAQSGPFNSFDYIQRKGLLSSDTLKQKVDELEEGKYSEPFLLKTDVSKCTEDPKDCQAQLVDTQWIIPMVDKINNNQKDPTKLLGDIRNKYGAKIY